MDFFGTWLLLKRIVIRNTRTELDLPKSLFTKRFSHPWGHFRLLLGDNGHYEPNFPFCDWTKKRTVTNFAYILYCVRVDSRYGIQWNRCFGEKDLFKHLCHIL